MTVGADSSIVGCVAAESEEAAAAAGAAIEDDDAAVEAPCTPGVGEPSRCP